MNGLKLFADIKQHGSFREMMILIKDPIPSVNQSKRGNLYEKTWDLIIKFGIIPDLTNYTHFQGNINTGILNKVSNLETYINNLSVFSRGSGGSSDITCYNETADEWLFISSKFYINDANKSIDDYDIAQIMAAILENQHKYKKYKIWLLVNNKNKVNDIINASGDSSKHLKKNINNILDLNDLEHYFKILKKLINNIHNVSELSLARPILLLRFHQDLITHNQMIKIEGGSRELLLGAKARSGKTYCVGGLLIKYYKKYNKLNALIITPCPTETMPQFTDDLFNKFRDFIPFNILEIKRSADISTEKIPDNNIIIISKQLLDGYVGENSIKPFTNIDLDFIIFDENHFHGTTDKVSDIYSSYVSNNTIKLYLTATYIKSLNKWNIPPECCFYWSIEDEQLCKKRDFIGLAERHANVELFNHYDLSVYDNMPELKIISITQDSMRYDELYSRIEKTKYGYSSGTFVCGKYSNEVNLLL